MDQNIFVIGQGGREHAIAWKLSKSNKIDNVYACPGNGGTSLEENIINIDINIKDKNSLIDFAKNNNIIMMQKCQVVVPYSRYIVAPQGNF